MEKEDGVACGDIVDKRLSRLLRGPWFMVRPRTVVGLGENDERVLIQAFSAPARGILHPVKFEAAVVQGSQPVPGQRGRMGAVVAKDQGPHTYFPFGSFIELNAALC